jgi:hypothetical protein
VPRISEEERLRSERKARVEAWDRALKILRPWVNSTRHMGSEELSLLRRWPWMRACGNTTMHYRRALRRIVARSREARTASGLWVSVSGQCPQNVPNVM